MTKASAYETEVSSGGEELKALATAKKIIVEATSLAQTDSFVQLVSTTKGNKIVHILKKLASSQSSTALSQLASRVQSAIRLGSHSGEDPFAKVKELVADMLAKLQKEAEEDATQKAFRDKGMKETKAKKDDKTAEVEKLTTKKEQKEAQSAKLKEEVATLQKELAEIASTQSEMDSLRAEEKATYEETKPELEKVVAGIQKALKVLKDYYAKAATHSASEGAGSGIIGLLEVSDSLSNMSGDRTTEAIQKKSE